MSGPEHGVDPTLDPTPQVIDSLIGPGAHGKGFRLARGKRQPSGRVNTVFCWPGGGQSDKPRALAHARQLGVPVAQEVPRGAERTRAPRHVWYETVVARVGWQKQDEGGGKRSSGKPIVAWVNSGAVAYSARAAYRLIPIAERPKLPEWMWMEGEAAGDSDGHKARSVI